MPSPLDKLDRAALLGTIDDPYDRADENPYKLTDEVHESDRPEPSLPGKALDVAGNFVDVLEDLPDLSHSQRKIAYLISLNKSPRAIAAQCGVSAAYVRNLKADERIRQMVEIFRGGKIYQVMERLSPQELLDLAAVRAAEVLAEKMNAALSEEIQLRAALEVLKMTGHGGKEDSAPVQIVIDPGTIAAYREARREAGIEAEIVEAEVIDEGS